MEEGGGGMKTEPIEYIVPSVGREVWSRLGQAGHCDDVRSKVLLLITLCDSPLCRKLAQGVSNTFPKYYTHPTVRYQVKCDKQRDRASENVSSSVPNFKIIYIRSFAKLPIIVCK